MDGEPRSSVARSDGFARPAEVPAGRSETETTEVDGADSGQQRATRRAGRYTEKEDACIAQGLDKYWERPNKWEEIKRRAGSGLEGRSEVSIARRAANPAFLSKYAGHRWAREAGPTQTCPRARDVHSERVDLTEEILTDDRLISDSWTDRYANEVATSTSPVSESQSKYSTAVNRAMHSLRSLEECLRPPPRREAKPTTDAPDSSASPNPDMVADVCRELIAPPCDDMWLEVAPSQCCALRSRLRGFFRTLLAQILLMDTDPTGAGTLRISEREDALGVARAALNLAEGVSRGLMESGTSSSLVDLASVSLDVIREWALLRDADNSGKSEANADGEALDAPHRERHRSSTAHSEGLSFCTLTVGQCFSGLAVVPTASSDESGPQFSQTYVLTLRSLVMKVHTVRLVLSACGMGGRTQNRGGVLNKSPEGKLLRAWLLTAWNAGLEALEVTGDRGGAHDLRLQLALEGDDRVTS